DCLWDQPAEDFFSSESESDDDMEHYIPPLPYGEFKDWEMVSCPPVVHAGSSSSVPADYVSAGHVLVSADRDRIC
ncbi:hypothetical protein Tco_0112867, partial [Tanacetum coccineum]